MLKLLDFPFAPSDAQAAIYVLSAPYLLWPARADDGSEVSVYVRLSALEEALGVIGDHPGRDLRNVVRESLLKHRTRIEEAADRLYAAGAPAKIFLEPIDFGKSMTNSLPSGVPRSQKKKRRPRPLWTGHF